MVYAYVNALCSAIVAALVSSAKMEGRYGVCSPCCLVLCYTSIEIRKIFELYIPVLFNTLFYDWRTFVIAEQVAFCRVQIAGVASGGGCWCRWSILAQYPMALELLARKRYFLHVDVARFVCGLTLFMPTDKSRTELGFF